MADGQPEAGYPTTDTPGEMVIAGRSGVSTLRAPLPDSPQEVQDISAQEVEDEAFANVGASVGQTTPHTSSFMSSLGLGYASGKPAPDYFRLSLSPPATQAMDMLSVEVPQATLGTPQASANPAVLLSDPSYVTHLSQRVCSGQ